MSLLKKGDVVECLDGSKSFLKAGEQYTIKEVHRGENGLYYSVEGFKDAYNGFDASRFRLVSIYDRKDIMPGISELVREEEENALPVQGHGPVQPDNTKASNPKDSIGDKKVPLWLCSPIAKAQWAVCQFVGMVKYGAWNWRSAGVRSSVYLAAMQRHIDAYTSGEEVDPIDQTPHLGHIMACAAILIDAKAAGKLTDDRPPSVGLRQAYAEVEGQMELARKNYGHMTPKHYTIKDTIHESKT